MADRPAWLANYQPELIRRGLSATAALNIFRQPTEEGGLGLHVSTTEWYSQWSESLRAMAAREGFMPVNWSRRPTEDQITSLTSRRATGFLYSFNVLVRNNATGESYYMPSGYRSDKRVSFTTARQGAVDAIAFAAAEGSPSVSDVDVLGVLPVEVRQYVPGGA